jgi:hypothetical protein
VTDPVTALLLIACFVSLIALDVAGRPRPSNRVLDLTPLIGKRRD